MFPNHDSRTPETNVETRQGQPQTVSSDMLVVVGQQIKSIPPDNLESPITLLARPPKCEVRISVDCDEAFHKWFSHAERTNIKDLLVANVDRAAVQQTLELDVLPRKTLTLYKHEFFFYDLRSEGITILLVIDIKKHEDPKTDGKDRTKWEKGITALIRLVRAVVKGLTSDAEDEAKAAKLLLLERNLLRHQFVGAPSELLEFFPWPVVQDAPAVHAAAREPMNRVLLLLVESISHEKSVEREIVLAALEAAIAAASKKEISGDIRVAIDRDTCEYVTFRRWRVVSARSCTSPWGQEKTASQEGCEYFERQIDSVPIGRIDVQAAKQVVLKKIRDAEREALLNEFLSIRALFNSRIKSVRQGREGLEIVSEYPSEENVSPALFGRTGLLMGNFQIVNLVSTTEEQIVPLSASEINLLRQFPTTAHDSGSDSGGTRTVKGETVVINGKNGKTTVTSRIKRALQFGAGVWTKSAVLGNYVAALDARGRIAIPKSSRQIAHNVKQPNSSALDACLDTGVDTGATSAVHLVRGGLISPAAESRLLSRTVSETRAEGQEKPEQLTGHGVDSARTAFVLRGGRDRARKIPAEAIAIKAIREKLEMTQEQFAVTFGLSVASLRNWEQGTRVPERPIALYLRLIDNYPEQVKQVVASERAPS